ncbi:MAG: PmeII family type II restriction endonuclease [Nitrospirota bacterium]|nr:PmeII family type II restriction endonuclease [Nitrospirota bacterium]
MGKIENKDVITYIEKNISAFHGKRLLRLGELKLSKVLKKKNPYLFKAKNIHTAQDLVKPLLDAYLSSQEETIFGDFLEGLAIFICEKVYKGRKSSTTGIDLEFDKDGIRYVVSIKSGPNWGNSQAVNKMISNFNSARKILKTSNFKINVVAVNGCCYGRMNNPYKEKGDYFKYCGQQFWEFISDNENLYTEIIEPLGHKSKERNEEFMVAYSQIINKFTLDFMREFCVNGKVDWKKLVKFNSEKR